MLQAVIDNTLEGHPESEARTATEVSHLYGLLASLFRAEPTAELLKALRSDELQPLLADSGLTLDDDLLGETDEQALIEKLAIEFTALFLGPGGHISPHESVHASQRGGILWGEETVKVKRYIESLGMTFSEEYQGLLDHISVERVVAMVAPGEELEVRIGTLEPGGDLSQSGVLVAPGVVRQVATVARSAVAEPVRGKREPSEANRTGGRHQRLAHVDTRRGASRRAESATTATAPITINT